MELDLASKILALFDNEAALVWVTSPNNLLSGESPAERIAKGRPGDVDALLEGLLDGVVF